MNPIYMASSYAYPILALSIIIAVLASYTALDLVARVRAAEPAHAYAWLGAGGTAMGTGIWSMHFVGMLAFDLPIQMGYDGTLTALSWLMGVIGSLVALGVASRARLSPRRLLIGAFFMAAAIVSMHYIGMAAMLMRPGIIYDPLWVAISIAIALVSSAMAMWVAFYLRDEGGLKGLATKLRGALLLGTAIAGMHYAGMEASLFPIGSICGAATKLDENWLALFIGASTILLLGIAMMAAALDRRLENRTSQLVESLRAANAELHHASHYDPLTHLANRTQLQECLNEALDRWFKDRVRFVVLYIDLDGFKLLNDNLGHDAGDQLLKRVSAAMTESVRRGDTVARIGGDEFVILVNDVLDEHAVALVCNKLLGVIMRAGIDATNLTASIGSALCPDHGQDTSELITAADMAMYAAKTAGKNRHACYRPYMANQIADEFQIQTELGHAIESNQITVYFQPQYSARERTLVGAEALARWKHPKRGMIPPDRFVAVAERCGLIDDLETYILRQVCAQIRAWLDAGYEVPRISVNLSAIRIRDGRLPGRVQACLDDYRLDARYLMFEITETVAVQEILRSIETLKHFSAMGVGVAIDDFGTGHSSLSYLNQLPIQQLKIDRSFITRLGGQDANQAAVARSIISLAHTLQLSVVAEGVETEEQLTYLNRFECDEVQGFLFSKPVPPDEFIALVAPLADIGRSGHAPADIPGPVSVYDGISSA